MTDNVEKLTDSITLMCGDCLTVLKTLEDNSIDSVVTDPPYGLEFMSKEWDGSDGFRRSLNEADGGRDNAFGRLSSKGPEYKTSGRKKSGNENSNTFQEFNEAWATECLRVLKPGGNLLAFGGTRTYHRLACAVEDSGFEIRDTIMWVYGSGFPKSLNVSAAIDKAAGAERPIVDAARQWSGFGTSLKPAYEPIILARKPLSESNVAANVLKWGTGALNIDGCRVATDASDPNRRDNASLDRSADGATYNLQKTQRNATLQNARWPANVIHDGSDEVVGAFPETGTAKEARIGIKGGENALFMSRGNGVNAMRVGSWPADQGGSAARFFYTAKADADDRLGSKHPCLPPGELVLTDHGLAPIETIDIGSLVYADDGTFRSVVNKFDSPCSDCVYTIGVEATNLRTRATGNHPFLVWRPKITYGRARDTLAVGSAFWLPAEQVKIGDYLLTPIVASTEAPPETDVDWWFAAGLWMAEGTVLTNGHGSSRFPQYTLSATEGHLVERLRAVFKNVGVYPRGKAISVVGFRSGVVDRFIQLCGRGAKAKFVSPIVLAAGDDQRRAFLEGYIAGDGCVVRGRYRAKTASRSLASTLPLLAESLGLRCALYEYDSSGRSVHIAGRPIKQGIYYSILFEFERLAPRYSRPKGKASSTRFIEYEGRTYSLRRVKSVDAQDYRGPVWNLTVEGRHAFQTAVGMSHNTVKPLDLMQYLVRLVTPPKGLCLDLFAGTGTVGEACMREGMNAILVEKEPDYQEDCRRRMRLATAGPMERKYESIKSSGKMEASDSLPLFGSYNQEE